MYTVYFADDHAFERKKLNAIIDWEQYGIEIVGEADNGGDAYEDCLALRPNILITDIRMPEMDGLSLARELSKHQPQTKIIFLSAYDDFDYARTAVKLNVCSYLLKPYTASQLADALRSAVDMVEKEAAQREREAQYETYFQSVLGDLRQAFVREVIDFGEHISEAVFWEKAASIQLQFSSDHFVMLRLEYPQGLLFAEVRELVQRATESLAANRCIMPEYNCCYLLICVPKELSDQGVSSLVESVASSLTETFSEKGYPLSIRKSTTGYRYRSWRRLYGELNAPPGEQKGKRDTQDTAELLYLQYKAQEEELFTAIVQQQNEFVYRYISELTQQLELYGIKTAQCTKLCVSCYNKAWDTLKQMGAIAAQHTETLERCLQKLPYLESPVDIELWMTGVFNVIKTATVLSQRNKNEHLINRVIELVAARYADNIDVTSISAELYISPNYLRHLFKTATGTSLSVYLTDYRIKRACELLQNTSHRISDIPGMVGLEHNSHFYFLIKKSTGLTPSEYRAFYGDKQGEDPADAEQ
ncbi:MAG: response regulator [Oscillospiraceae bacterium]|nr:response regulator [Oscillospiraceae bacterium]